MNANALDTRVPPPVLLVAIAFGMWWLTELGPAMPMPPALRGALVAVIALAGVAFNVSGFRAIRRVGSTIDPTRPASASALVVEGPFRISRNPMYVGFALLLLAWAFYLQSAWGLIGPALFVVYLNQFQIGPEERALADKFGNSFSKYRSRVRRWL